MKDEEKMKKPNILIIQTDQQSSWTLGAYGGTIIETPNIDAIAEQGATFTDFIVTSAVCTPSRGSFLTGRYPCCHGAYRNTLAVNRDERTLAHILGDNGYHTSYVGKWHMDGEDHPPESWVPTERALGFQDSRYMQNRGHYKSYLEKEDGTIDLSYAVGKGAFATDWFTDKSIEIIKERCDKPFFHMLSIPDPHTPYTVREPYASMYRPEDMPIPDTFYEDNHPSWIEDHAVAADSTWGIPDAEREADLRKNKAIYCGEVKCIDDNVGRLLSALEETGVLDNTIVVFTTDHGDYMGEHGLYGKNMVYQAVYQVPMLIRWPETIKAGTVIDRTIGATDFQQTILGLMEMQPCGREQGDDASSLLRGEDMDWKDEAFIHNSRFNFAGIFTPQHEMAFTRFGQHMLFDRKADPEQICNLFDDPSCQDIVKDLGDRIVAHNRELDSPAMEWLV